MKMSKLIKPSYASCFYHSLFYNLTGIIFQVGSYPINRMHENISDDLTCQGEKVSFFN